MNLILSDVEETIMIVDQQEGAPGGQHTVNASLLLNSCFCSGCSTDATVPDRKAQDGHVIRTR